jgi:hypothetical protein
VTLDLPTLRMRLLPLLLAVLAAMGVSAAGMSRAAEGSAQPELSSDQAAERPSTVRPAERGPYPMPPAPADDGRSAVPTAAPAAPAPIPMPAAMTDTGRAPGAGHATPRFPTGPPSGLPHLSILS